jgi:hypothetical protein
MKVIVAVFLLTFPVLLSCATSKGAANQLKTFLSPDGAFQFTYSQILFRCPQRNEPEDKSEPPGTCEGQQSVCDDDDESTSTVVCLGYPERAAAFAVAQIKEAKTEVACMKGPEDWPMEMHGTRTIHGVKFKVFDVSTAWTSGGLNGELYRAFRLNKCYELGIRRIRTSVLAYESGDIVQPTKEDAIRVGNRLEEPLKSFRFLK